MFVADADVVSSVETAAKVTTVAAALAAMLSVHVIVRASAATAVVNVAVRTVWVAETAYVAVCALPSALLLIVHTVHRWYCPPVVLSAVQIAELAVIVIVSVTP